MPTRSLALLAAFGVSACVGAAPPSAPCPPPGEAAPSAAAVDVRGELQALLDADSAAWNRGDLASFVASYTDDALFLSPSGLTEGRAAVLARYQKKYGDAPETMGTLSLEIVDTEVSLGPDGAPAAAVVVARWHLRWTDREPPEDASDGLTMLAFRRDGDRWRIVYDASM